MDRNAVAARIAAHLDAYAALWPFQGAVGASVDGEPLPVRAYGLASVELGVPNAPGTRFLIWSLTKRFTAAAVLLLEERGALRTADPLAAWFPDAPGLDRAITLAHLLGHASGLPNYSSDAVFPDSRRTFQRAHHAPEALLGLFSGLRPDFAPGTAFRYCNTGYWFLGEAIARASGRPYAEFLQAEVLFPLGLADTGVDDGRTLVPGAAQGHYLDGGGLVRCGYTDMDLVRASGGMFSTVADLLRWERALREGRLLRPETVARMETPGLGGYGLGVFVDREGGRRRVRHNGGHEGFLAELRSYPDDGVAAAVLSNTGFANVGGIAHDVAMIAFGEDVAPPQRPPEHPLSIGAAEAIVGVYEGGGSRIEVRGAGRGRFEIVLDGTCRLPAYPVRADALHHEWIDEEYVFEEGADGRPTLWGLPKRR